MIRCERLLPTKGEVLVAVGDAVSADTVIARTKVYEAPVALPIAAMLGEEGRDVSDRISKKVGDQVAVNEVLASKKGFLGREVATCVSPVAGTVTSTAELASTGVITISPPPRELELTAGLAGTVVEVLAGSGAVISGAAVFAHGLAMAGEEVRAPLWVAANAADGEVVVDDGCAGRVVLGGHANAAILARAHEVGAKAVVVGSVTAEAWHQALAGQFKGLTVFVTEGIGRVPMGERTFKDLSRVHGFDTWLTPGRKLGVAPMWPEIIVSLDEEMEWEAAQPRLEPGAAVRVAAGEHAGLWGKVLRVRPRPRRLSHGPNQPVAVVALSTGRRTQVPVSSLELVG